jgi:hypothetical protein
MWSSRVTKVLKARSRRVYQSPAVGPRMIDDWDFANEPKKAVCPTIVGPGFDVPPRLAKMIRFHPKPFSVSGGLKQLPGTNDIWTTYNRIEAHTDDTWKGKVTYGMVLANDAERKLFHGSRTWEIPAGSLYRLDGRIVHGTCDGAPYGLFAALIWDTPWKEKWTLIDFIAELLKDKRFAND